MSRELRELIAGHRARLVRLVKEHRQFFAMLEHEQPGLIEREAAATAIHSFYTGIEFILRSIAERFDGSIPKTGAWHAELLDSMRYRTELRGEVLTEASAERLKGYLVFRHRFRNIYGFELDWAMMQPLAQDMEETLTAVEADLDRFLAAQPEL